MRCLVYGAYGYTGDLIARRAAAQGLKPILAGRSRAPLDALAQELGLPSRVVGLDDAAALDAALAGVDVVIHCAGPFSRTSKPMVDACLRSKKHYLDITGEIDVFEACAARDAEARAAGVMLMPGTGFDVVPSDCLALYLARRLPSATHLRLAFTSVGGGSSHGTALTAVEGLNKSNLVRENGAIKAVRTGDRTATVDFGRGPKPALGIPWGDVSTAGYSTQIPNIEVFMGLPRAAVIGATIAGRFPRLLGAPAVQRMLKKRIDAGPAGPTAEQRKNAVSLLVGEARDATRTVSARLRTLEGYTLTAAASLVIAERVLAGTFEPGYRTPASVFGPDFILGFDGTERTDLDRSPFV